MDTQELKQYLADAPPTVVRLEIEKHFDALNAQQKKYAHFISRYAYVASLECVNLYKYLKTDSPPQGMLRG